MKYRSPGLGPGLGEVMAVTEVGHPLYTPHFPEQQVPEARFQERVTAARSACACTTSAPRHRLRLALR